MNDYMNLVIDHLIKKSLIEKGEYKGEKRRKLEAKIADHKREWRRKTKRNQYFYHGRDGEGYGEIVNGGGNWDSYWQKVFFPGEQWTEEEKREFVEDNWVHATPSQYDCTGQVFTWAIDVFNVPGGVVAYLRYALDV